MEPLTILAWMLVGWVGLMMVVSLVIIATAVIRGVRKR